MNELQTIKQEINAQLPVLATALGMNIDKDRAAVLKYASTAISTIQASPGLLKCTPKSLFDSIRLAAQRRLPIDASGFAYLVPFRDNKTNTSICTMMLGFRGLRELAMRTGRYKSINSMCVYSNEAFEWIEGDESKLVHKPALTDEGEFVAVYATAVLTDGSRQHIVLRKSKVEKTRDGSQAYQSAKRFGKKTIWDSEFDEMAKKTAVRALCKELGMDTAISETHEFIQYDSAFAEQAKQEAQVVEVVAEEVTPEAPQLQAQQPAPALLEDETTTTAAKLHTVTANPSKLRKAIAEKEEKAKSQISAWTQYAREDFQFLPDPVVAWLRADFEARDLSVPEAAMDETLKTLDANIKAYIAANQLSEHYNEQKRANAEEGDPLIVAAVNAALTCGWTL